jgi:predicted transcriptional regulator
MAMTLRTDEELEAALTALAEAEGISRQEVIRRAVLERRDRAGHRTRVDTIASDAIVEYAEALERLGTV